MLDAYSSDSSSSSVTGMLLRDGIELAVVVGRLLTDLYLREKNKKWNQKCTSVLPFDSARCDLLALWCCVNDIIVRLLRIWPRTFYANVLHSCRLFST